MAEHPNAQLEELAALLVGTPYRPLQLLGRGAIGDVYMVEHEFLGKKFALKRIHARCAALPGFVERARLEAQALGRLQHPNVVEVIEYWPSQRGVPCLVLELLRGRALREELLRQGRLPETRAVTIAQEVLAGLEAAHALGIVHRDIKPENVFLHHPPGFEMVTKVLDFGLARVLLEVSAAPPAAHEVRTATGALVGSPRYYSPEAIRREPVDHRADLFGVGLILYEMLTGRGPYDLDRVLPPSELTPGLSSGLDAVVMRSLQESRRARFQSAREFSIALEAVSPRPSRSPTSWRPAPGWVRTPD